jgi:hypothetical protein
MKEVNAPNGGCEDSLIAFLYGELNRDEAQLFRNHLQDCAACATELTNFQDVRESVVAWRNESLGGVNSPASLSTAAVEKPSALAALRQFFNLAPLWMKGSVAFASVLFCLFAGLAITRWQSSSSGSKVTSSNTGESLTNPYSQQQLDAMVAQRVKEELERIKQSQEKSSGTSIVVSRAGSPSRRHVARRGQEVAANVKARRPLSKTEREQLAADLRLISARNENEFDLLDDGINQ